MRLTMVSEPLTFILSLSLCLIQKIKETKNPCEEAVRVCMRGVDRADQWCFNIYYSYVQIRCCCCCCCYFCRNRVVHRPRVHCFIEIWSRWWASVEINKNTKTMLMFFFCWYFSYSSLAVFALYFIYHFDWWFVVNQRRSIITSTHMKIDWNGNNVFGSGWRRCTFSERTLYDHTKYM